MMLSLGGTASRFFLPFSHRFIFSLLLPLQPLPKLIASSMDCAYCYRKASVYDKREIYHHVYPCGYKLTVMTPIQLFGKAVLLSEYADELRKSVRTCEKILAPPLLEWFSFHLFDLR